ncbi:endonuclease domain of the non-LTR retrotransposon LINE-1 [Elysia marginata]|uniref:Endonuclease domain of the non-LTR retrotransposon LINE-1 n=1 Tax=Elysia marginata TaxID=1093978 RepID=A0AAV4HTG0_9GAST|nr:endonuclease domain of the non-LTR retrotransposon LINE-1 [Elysia marginata]
MLKSLRPDPDAPRPPAVDLSFIKIRTRGRKGGVKAKHQRRGFRPFLSCVITGNVRSLHNKTDELYSLCRFNSNYRHALIITVTETWLNENIPSSVCDLDNFTLIRHDRQGIQGKERGGGMCTFCQQHMVSPSML